MRQLRLLFLLSVALLSSGYRWRCYIFCEEQTGIQNDYVEERDQCREYAQNNLEAELEKTKTANTPKTRQAKLVILFSECMAQYGWDVPSGEKSAEKKIAEKGGDVSVNVYPSASAKSAPAIEKTEPKPLIIPKPVDCKVPAGNVSKLKTKKKVRRSKCKNYDTAPVQPAQQNKAAQPAPSPKPKTVEAAPVVPVDTDSSPKAPEQPTAVPQPPSPPAPAQPAPVETPPSPKPPEQKAPPAPEPKPPAPVTPEPPIPEPTTKRAPKKDPAVDLLDSQLKPSFWDR